jgi:hypothetical protein
VSGINSIISIKSLNYLIVSDNKFLRYFGRNLTIIYCGASVLEKGDEKGDVGE